MRKNVQSKETIHDGVFELLKKDHRNVKQMFSRILKEHHRSDDAFNQIHHELEAHMGAEEKHLYPVLQAFEKIKDMIIESYEEHSVGKEIIQQVEQETLDEDHWLAKVKVLSDVIDHHIQEEEELIFPKAKKFLNKEENQKITDLILREKGLNIGS